ncbi:trypsin-like peptidase domain-containing protein [Sphingobacterium sp. SGG-5]|uniref:S1C family serine protease n=1 Tax=Sphingobacterium sp. SGG-5 TaxID=2710881 RepID=UPI0013ECF63B|nr:serine protease [Sphingobacterium sp. SGG-5]NGM62803.1 trypsin-like peptidase domain-containing protein [Sphingobacterium sp. SGG-5]
MRRQDFLDWADQYMRGELSKEDQIAFEEYCKEHPEITVLLEEHTSFLKLWKDTEERKALRLALAKEGKNIKSNSSLFSSQKILSLWSRLQINAAVAATVALVSVFSTLWLTGYFTNIKKATTDYSALRREMNSVKRNVNEQNKVIRDINNNKTKNTTPIHFGATGFMLTKDGYVVTNNHVINGADSVHLQNSKGQSFRAKIVYSDAIKDLAILHIDDTGFKPLKNVPYTFKKQKSELGEDIYTIGFPRDEAVYGQGYLSSNTGYVGDTIAYQISIPVNPGNSGGPVLDNQGNIIGIISGKQKGIDGAAFAIKTKELIETLNRIPADSLKGNIVLNNKNTLANLPRTEQIKKLQDYIYIVKVF